MADDGAWAALVPELLCGDLATSLAFYCDLVGFRIRFLRREDQFAYLDLGGAQLMLEQTAEPWATGILEHPYGRGINLQIEVANAPALRDRLVAAGVALFRDIAVAWYRVGDIEHGQCQFLVQDPDGYLLRFAQSLGERRTGNGAD